MKQHRLAALGLAAGLLGGGAAGFALGVPGFASAQTTDSAAPSTPGQSTPAPAKPADRARWMRDALAPLVGNGTITQAQADAVIGALEEARSLKGRGGPGRGGFRFGIGRHLTAAADALGISAEELRTALREGQSLADVARDRGVDPERVVDALVAQLKTHLDAAVTAGRLTQAQADEKLSGATDRIRAKVNGELPLKGGRGRHGFGGPRPDQAPADAEPSSMTTTA